MVSGCQSPIYINFPPVPFSNEQFLKLRNPQLLCGMIYVCSKYDLYCYIITNVSTHYILYNMLHKLCFCRPSKWKIVSSQ